MHRRQTKSPSRAGSPVSIRSTNSSPEHLVHIGGATNNSAHNTPTATEVPSIDAFHPHRSSLTAVDLALLCLNPKSKQFFKQFFL